MVFLFESSSYPWKYLTNWEGAYRVANFMFILYIEEM
jgi:hypothetical protein